MKDLMRRLAGADLDVAIEMMRRGAFERVYLDGFRKFLAARALKPELQKAISLFLGGARLKGQPTWLASLSNGDRQIAIHAVVNARMTDKELAKLERLLKLQRGGHLLRQLQVALELEQNRRAIGGKRSSGNRITTRRA